MTHTINNCKTLNVADLHICPNLSVKYTDKELTATENVLKRFGTQIPVVIDNDNNVIVGENIFLAAKNLNFDQIPVVEIDALSKKEIKAFKIASKKILEFGEFDVDELKLEINSLLHDIDLNFTYEDLGFEAIEFDNLFFVEESSSNTKKQAEEEIVLPDIQPIVKPGDLIKLGSHLLYCGDALKAESYKILLKDEFADLIITDPPYNVKIQNNVTKRTQHDEFEQASGEMSKSEFENFLKNAFDNLKQFSKENSLHYIFMDWRHSYNLQQVCKNIYPKLHNICVWDKTKAGMGSFYRSQHEFCFVYQNGTGKYLNNIQLGSNGRNRSNIWQYQGMNIATKQANKLAKLHPTVKPVAMLSDIMLDASKPNDIVLDCFGGSGSTLIAAEDCNRQARLIELSPHYCDVIICRWEELTGEKHVLLTKRENING